MMAAADDRAATLERLRHDGHPVLIGLGAIGSWVARWLVANGIVFSGYDDDTVSLKNVDAGAFSLDDVGVPKSRAISPAHCYTQRWSASVRRPAPAFMVCADDGPTRRDAAVYAREVDAHFICAKANGGLWQVWDLRGGGFSIDDFIAFDEAAEDDPVPVPCGDSSVGRVASIGAAAELLSAWSGLEVTPDEVEASYGVTYDPAAGHAMRSEWERRRAEAEAEAEKAARAAFDARIDELREQSDGEAIAALNKLRRERAFRRWVQRSTIHMRAITSLDTGSSVNSAAQNAVTTTGSKRPLRDIAETEARIKSEAILESIYIPSTVEILEVLA